MMLNGCKAIGSRARARSAPLLPLMACFMLNTCDTAHGFMVAPAVSIVRSRGEGGEASCSRHHSYRPHRRRTRMQSAAALDEQVRAKIENMDRVDGPCFADVCVCFKGCFLDSAHYEDT